jgi:hypothetical protein
MGSPGSIEIDETEYIFIRTARVNLFEALFIEEKLDMVIEDYYEYETDLLSMASRMMIFHDEDYYSMGDERSLVSRRIINLLSACRAYLDQSIQHVGKIYAVKSDNWNLVTTEIASQYNQRLGYRVMEAMRNYVQHRGFPIHNIGFPHERTGPEDDFQLSNRVIPMISLSALEDDNNFKKSVLKELKEIYKKDLIDVRPLIREYIEGIGRIHKKTRDLLHSDLFGWEKILDDTIAKYKDSFGKEIPLAGLVIIIENDKGGWEESKAIFKEFVEKRKALEKKNRRFINLCKSYASNEIRNRDG